MPETDRQAALERARRHVARQEVTGHADVAVLLDLLDGRFTARELGKTTTPSLGYTGWAAPDWHVTGAVGAPCGCALAWDGPLEELVKLTAVHMCETAAVSVYPPGCGANGCVHHKPLTAEGAGPLLDPDCRDGKCGSCVGAPCEHYCHKQAGPGEGPAVTEQPCEVVRGNFECTRPLGHDGDHIAHDTYSQVVDRWPQEVPGAV
jgi:hypothetical protein